VSLTDRDRRVLDIAGRTYTYANSREGTIRVELDLSWTEYNVILNRLLDDPDALAYAPSTVNRLRRQRDTARRRRDRRAATLSGS
jgi:hypothetical protein